MREGKEGWFPEVAIVGCWRGGRLGIGGSSELRQRMLELAGRVVVLCGMRVVLWFLRLAREGRRA